MRSTRATNVVLVGLVLVPTGVLAALSFSNVDAYRAEVGARMRRELAIMQLTFDAQARAVVEADAEDCRRRAAAAARALERALPFRPAQEAFALAGQAWAGPSAGQGRPGTAPSGIRLRVVDARGRAVLPVAFDPEA